MHREESAAVQTALTQHPCVTLSRYWNVSGQKAPCSPGIRARPGVVNGDCFSLDFQAKSFPPPPCSLTVLLLTLLLPPQFPSWQGAVGGHFVPEPVLEHRVGGSKLTECLHCTDVSHKTNRAEAIWREKNNEKLQMQDRKSLHLTSFIEDGWELVFDVKVHIEINSTR